MTLAAEGSAPPEWGCDAFWSGGDPVLEKCAAAFGVAFEYGPAALESPLLAAIVAATPDEAETSSDDIPGVPSIDLSALLPSSAAHYQYYGSLVRSPAFTRACLRDRMLLSLEGTKHGLRALALDRKPVFVVAAALLVSDLQLWPPCANCSAWEVHTPPDPSAGAA